MKIEIGSSLLPTALLCIFITLKLCKIIAWSWWWVLSPIWASLAIFLSIVLTFGVGALITLGIACIKDLKQK